MTSPPTTELPSDAFPRVYIATTGGPCRIGRIQPRPQIRSSFVSPIGSFQMLPWSAQYDTFVRNILPQAIPAPGPFSMTVENSPDFGRSWELPVLIAHLLQHHGATDMAVWATGRLDADLAPVPADDYEITTKIAQSRDVLAGLAADGLAIIPPPVSASERARIEADLAEIGCRCAFPGTLAEVHACLGLPAPKPWPLIATVASAGLLAVVLGIWSANWSGSSTPGNILPDTPAAAPLTVQGSYAEEKSQCMSRFMEQVPMQETQAKLSKPNATYRLPALPTLCDLRFHNSSAGPVEIRIDPALIALGVMGTDQYAEPQELGPNQYITIGLKQGPKPGPVTIQVDGRPFVLMFER